MSDNATTSPTTRNKPLPVKTIEHNLNEIYRRLDRELGTPSVGRDVAANRRLADLHRSDAPWWKECLATAKVRLAWLAASAAADRAHQLAMRHQEVADALAQRGEGARTGRSIRPNREVGAHHEP